MDELKQAIVPTYIQSLGLEGSLELWVPAHEDDSIIEVEAEEQNFDCESILKSELIAFDSGIFTRKTNLFPRCVHWNVFKNQTLVLTEVSLKNDSSCIPSFNIRIHFPSQILKNCVTFGFDDEKNELSLFVITSTRVLYSIKVKPEWFLSSNPTVDEGWCTCFRPPSFLTKTPSYSTAVNRFSLFVTFNSGGLLKLNTSFNSDEIQEEHYHDSRYMTSIRHYLTLQAFKDDYRPPNSIVSMTYNHRYHYLLTMSLDHKLKIWNALNGVLLETISFEPTSMQNSNALSYLSIDSCTQSYVSIYHPNETRGYFSLYRFELDPDDGSFVKLSPVTTKIAPPHLPDDEFLPWTLLKTNLVCLDTRDLHFSLSLAWKSNLHAVIQCAYVVPNVDNTARVSWKSTKKNGFIGFDKFSFDIPTSMSFGDVSEIWVNNLLNKKHISPESLQLALLCSQKVNPYTSKSKMESLRSTSLNELMKEITKMIIGSVPVQPEFGSSSFDYSAYRQTLYNEWERFAKLTLYLDSFGDEILNIEIDSNSKDTYVCYASKIGVLRQPVYIEYLDGNLISNMLQLPEMKAPALVSGYQLLDLGCSLVSCLPSATLMEIRFSLQELTKNPASYSVFDTLWIFFDKYIYPNVNPDHLKSLAESFASRDNPVGDIKFLLDYIRDFPENSVQFSSTPFFSLALSNTLIEVLEKLQTSLEALIFLLSIACSQQDVQLEQKVVGSDGIFLELLGKWKVVSFFITTFNLPLEQVDIDSSKVGDNTLQSNLGTISHLNTPFEVLTTLFCRENALSNQFSSIQTSIKSFTSRLLEDSSSNQMVSEAFEKLLLLKQYNVCSALLSWLGFDSICQYFKAITHLGSKEIQKSIYHFKHANLNFEKVDLSERPLLKAYLDTAKGYSLDSHLSSYYLHVSKLLSTEGAYVDALEFSLMADAVKGEDENLVSDIRIQMFLTSCASSKFDTAYSTLLSIKNKEEKNDALNKFIKQLAYKGKLYRLIDYSMPSLQDEVDTILEKKSFQMIDVRCQPCWYNILYSWRLKNQNYRDAAAIIYEKLLRLVSFDGFKKEQETEILESYLIVLNALKLLDREEAWMLVTDVSKLTNDKELRYFPQKLVTLDNVLVEYEAHLQNVARNVTSQFSSTAAIGF
ncbi:nucleoporin Nup120 [Schizosaccharomyces cryophilus OY26]|uniref:Nucleoporin Nup120 n=1 Tax=Schizosaccharomyces cryophilus (strain OY26 / ATCC MYA-4695 / CBS 11777 / NBRC 106824 / NRRL Y48691) TaxID=653667 RepID=S9XIT5_SCHCR|nr:nucleoporin Nup120 [Schizosaccharomyces cryophilus OY26]EPY53551.1 nucleoporin Nup120 [Schizosaccharomyces cryophilus OY26]